MSIFEPILNWAVSLPEWQSDAVRRILTQDILNKDDEDEIFRLLKKQYGLIDDPKIIPKPLEAVHFGGVKNHTQRLTLKAIKNLKNVNAIKVGSGINFGHEGLTIIYGENGAGKSGYARVLKRACKARDNKEKIISNVYSADSSQPASAVFKVSFDGIQDDEIHWQDGNNGFEINSLSNISFFDSKCANIIIDENNEISYLPYGAQVFEELAQILVKLKERLDKEKPIVTKPMVEGKDLLYALEYIDKINEHTNLDQIETSLIWTQANEDEYIKIRKLVVDTDLNDPKKQAEKLRLLKSRIEKLAANLEKINMLLSKEKVDKINSLAERYQKSKEALLLLKNELISGDLLPGIGMNEWQILYNAAKAYSLTYAYPAEPFPNIKEDSICVLCMQPLSEKAQRRMNYFKDFMEDRIKKETDDYYSLLEEEVDEICKYQIIELSSIQDIIVEVSERDEKLANDIVSYLSTSDSTLKNYVERIKQNKTIVHIELYGFPIDAIKTIQEKFESEANEKEKIACVEVLEQYKKRMAMLESKKILCNIKQNILDYRKNLELSKKYQQCIAGTNTTAITTNGRRIISGALTPLLEKALKEEMQFFLSSYINLNVKSCGVKGEVKHKLGLDGCFKDKVRLSEVLSEGEQCVVAIGGFFAELKISRHKNPIVFDDPVNSLDHKFREKIADRIVMEAKERQVIVYTHDISFLSILKSKAALHKTPLFTQSVQRRIYAGECIDFTWNTMSVKERICYLNQERDKIQALYQLNIIEYDKKAGHLYNLLRETWEATIEEILLNEVIKRYSGEIQTLRIREITVTTDDYENIYNGMSKCSLWMFGHDKSKDVDIHRPSPEEIKDDIANLKSFVDTIRRRNTDTGKERKHALEAPMPNVG